MSVAKANDGAVVAERRRKVYALWLRGYTVPKIAAALKVTERTIERDEAAIRAELRRAHAEELETAQARAVATWREVQTKSWELHDRLAKDTTPNKLGALNTIAEAETKIARALGILTPEHGSTTTNTTNITVLAESPAWVALRTAILTALAPFPEARAAVATAIARTLASEMNESAAAALPVGSGSASKIVDAVATPERGEL